MTGWPQVGAGRLPCMTSRPAHTLSRRDNAKNRASKPSDSQAVSPRNSKVRLVEVDAEHVGRRLDNFLGNHLKGVPRNRLHRLCRKGEVRVNKGRVKSNYRLQLGDTVRIPPVRIEEKGVLPQPGSAVLQRIETAIVYEDQELIVLDKPSGMAVHGGSGLSYGVIEALRAARPKDRFLELVHRLDRDTSGLLLIARKRSALNFLHEQLREGRIDKQYLALVKGRWRGVGHWVDAPLRKNTLSGGERVVKVDASGKPSRSLFEVEQRYKTATLMRVTLDTGRTHQIRVHGQHMGHPLAGDSKYGDEAFNAILAGDPRGPLKRLFLHAWRLQFELPEGGKITLTAELDEGLSACLDGLRAL